MFIVPALDKEPNAFVDLTALLATGRASEALSDILGGLSERVNRLSHLSRTLIMTSKRFTGPQQVGYDDDRRFHQSAGLC
jgi:hypothetical protein